MFVQLRNNISALKQAIMSSNCYFCIILLSGMISYYEVDQLISICDLNKKCSEVKPSINLTNLPDRLQYK